MKHQWVEIKFTPVEVTEQADGNLKVEATDAAMEIAGEDSHLSCWFCHSELSIESFHTECAGDQTPPK